MTRPTDLPPDVLAGLRRLDPAADQSATPPHVLTGISSRIMAEATPDSRPLKLDELVDLAPSSSRSSWSAGGRRRLWAAAAVLLVVVAVAGAALSGRLSSAGPVIAAPPSATTASTLPLYPLAEGETGTAVRAVTVDGLQVKLFWENGQCNPGMPLDQQLVRTEFQPTPDGLQVLVVVKNNPAGQPKNGGCRGVGIQSTTIITLSAPLERAVILDQSTSPATVVVPESDSPSPIATYVAFPTDPAPREQLTGTLELQGDCLYVVRAGGSRTIALFLEERFHWADNLLLVGTDRAYGPGDTISLTGSYITLPDRRQVAKYSMPAGCDANGVTFIATD